MLGRCVLCLNLFLSALVARDHAPATRKGKVSYAASGDYAEALCAASLLNLVYDRALRLLATSPCVARGGACYDVCCLCRDCCADLGKLGLYVALLASCAVAVGAGKERDMPNFYLGRPGLALRVRPAGLGFYRRREAQRAYWARTGLERRVGGAYPFGAEWPTPDFLAGRRVDPDPLPHAFRRRRREREAGAAKRQARADERRRDRAAADARAKAREKREGGVVAATPRGPSIEPRRRAAAAPGDAPSGPPRDPPTRSGAGRGRFCCTANPDALPDDMKQRSPKGGKSFSSPRGAPPPALALDGADEARMPLSGAPPAPDAPSKLSASQAFKAALLVGVVVQNAALNIAARWSRVEAEAAFAETGCGAAATTVVLTVEVVKIAMALLLFALESGGVAPACAELARVTRAEPAECGKIAVPALALIYVVQNNLLLVAAANLEGPVLALFGQLKILTTAVFSVALLGRTLGPGAGPRSSLTAAIATVQVSQLRPAPESGDAGTKNVPWVWRSRFVATLSASLGAYFGKY
ncbi:pyrimidine nucleotide-sugar transmembrane transporter [Aureococcus anophagefferens]|nr:pyrimidine nucleotide-sugar transmembrane transporter [Aureococcus anophagefferens]